MNQQEFFNRYVYDSDIDRLGEGGFGTVFKAEDTFRNQDVAIKVALVRPGQENLSLQNEVDIAKKLKEHPNIAHYENCYRFKLHNGTFDYGILQFYPDGNLSQILRNKKLNTQQKEGLAKGILSGLKHLHDNHIVHRDLKSSNILIAKRGNEEYVPKIADFGLSKQFTEKDKSYFSNSFAGGSLHYVSPEQLTGKELRKNTDLWSLGVVLYELFVGEVPFRAEKDDGTETARQEIITKINNAKIPTSHGSISEPWQEVIRQCLVVDSTQRAKSVEDLNRIIDGELDFEKKGEDKKGDETTQIDTPTPPIIVEQEPKPFNYKYLWIGLGSVLIGAMMMIGLKDCGKTPQPAPSPTPRIDTILPKKVEPKAKHQEPTTEKPIEQEDSDGDGVENSKDKCPNEKGTLKGCPDSDGDGIADKEDKCPNEAGSKNQSGCPEPKVNSNDPFAGQMVRISGGSFQMGSEEGVADEKPVHTRNVSNFYMSRYEVTQIHWRNVMGTNPSYNKNCDNCPVEQVSWEEIQKFLKKLNEMTGKNYRLPTEAEWEYAARGGQPYKYAGSNSIGEVAWYNGNYKEAKAGSQGITHPVGQKKANGYGLYDMSGNVLEWCQDWYKGYPGSSGISDHTGSFRVKRGGGWIADSECCRVSYRSVEYPTHRGYSMGFRLAASQ